MTAYSHVRNKLRNFLGPHPRRRQSDVVVDVYGSITHGEAIGRGLIFWIQASKEAMHLLPPAGAVGRPQISWIQETTYLVSCMLAEGCSSCQSSGGSSLQAGDLEGELLRAPPGDRDLEQYLLEHIAKLLSDLKCPDSNVLLSDETG